ncbi:LysR family transcriptional regulator [Xanthobacter agilis]|jgi:LysR family nitrogen assimilation transcriptional regulator|uniref:LysR family nitrogen assimilation transcriptional regulator n=1 Tax=Xanthobacter agilis TaxID=47492 RepID=A0ABU0L879_XANAG|nr:LysR substrate-binding domain-containing protein [Xanthobacter agilis]MDQ0503361.1 LysR family nitrogen assimilation transcriptional regulator [Xanthobacter agilis]
MDLRQLRYFVTIVEVGSFSKAAHRLCVAQPALSQHVRNMELDLGVELLFRSPQGVRPTEAGETLVRHARLILTQVEVAQEAVRRGQSEPEGEVRFGLPGTVSEMLCVPLLSEARRRYPKIKLRVAEAMSGFVLDWLREGKIDLGVLYRSVSERTLQARRVLSEELCLLGPAASSDLPPLPDGPVSFAAMGDLPLILPSTGHGLRELVEERALAESVHLSTVIDIDTYGQIKLLVAGGLGYSVLPRTALRAEVANGVLRTWPMGRPVLSRNLYLVRPSDRPLSNAVRAIEELAHTTLVKLVREGAWPAVLAEDEPDTAALMAWAAR